MFRTRKFVAGIVALALAGAIAGCGNSPTSPMAPPPSSSDTLATDSLATPETPGLEEPAISLFGMLRNVLVRTSRLVGSLGTTLANGRWRVTMPPQAIQGDAAIAIGVVSSSSGECELEIVPASKNKFDIPVMLTVDCSAMSRTQLSNAVIYWFDPATRKWVVVPGSQVDLNNKTVSAPLDHFSRYSVGPAGGKAGW